MSKLMVAVGLAAAFVIANPDKFFDYLGPEAHVVGTKLRSAFDAASYVPTLRRAGL
jgi:hypothetical protein